MKKSALAFISALLMAAAAFVSCSDSSGSDGSGSISSGAGSENSAADDGVRSYVTARAEADGIHFSIEVPPQFDELGVGCINIFNKTIEEETGFLLEANVDFTEDMTNLVYLLVKPGKKYTFEISMEPDDKSDLAWREKSMFREYITVTAAGGLGEIEIMPGSSKRPVVAGYYDNAEDLESNCLREFVQVWFKEPDIKFKCPKEVEESDGEASVIVGDEDHWDSYTQWIGGEYSNWDCDDGYENIGSIFLPDESWMLENYRKYLAYANKFSCNTIMVQRRWKFSVPSSGFSHWLVSSTSAPADLKMLPPFPPED